VEQTCPECGLPAVDPVTREIDDYTHEVTAVCKRGHLWTTKWFAERSA
jgi:hypothetical protein